MPAGTPPCGGARLLASTPSAPLPDDSAICTPLTTNWRASIAATLMLSVAAAGAPVTYGAGPAFPAAATTTMPALAALSEAMLSGLVAGPNVPPSHMLITALPFGTAPSTASVITLLEPVQPKTP